MEKSNRENKGRILKLVIAVISALCLIVLVIVAAKALFSNTVGEKQEKEGLALMTESGAVTYTSVSEAGKTSGQPDKEEKNGISDADGSNGDEAEQPAVKSPVRISREDMDGLILGETETQQAPIGEKPNGDSPYEEPIDSWNADVFLKFCADIYEPIEEISKKTGVSRSLLKMFAVDKTCYGQLDPYTRSNNIYQLKDTTGSVEEKMYVDYINLWGIEVTDDGYYRCYDSIYDSVLDFAEYILAISEDPGDEFLSLYALMEDGYIDPDDLMKYNSKARSYVRDEDEA